VVPSGMIWVLQAQGLLIYARQIIIGEGASLILDFQKDSTSKLVLFGNEIQGILPVKAVFSPSSPPQFFEISETKVSPGVLIMAKDKLASLD
ncbi:hypothetical protein ACWKSR_11480, partial [Campylobacter fetus subsp. venerealis]